MNAIYDFTPKFCPNCGNPTRLYEIHPGLPFPINRNDYDYLQHASCVCKCGLHYQYADTDAIWNAAEASGGDLKRYVELGA